MKVYLLEGTLTALTSISHIGESFGINSKLRREKVVQPDGTVEEIPIISGNSLRGILRDRGMLHMLKTLGYGVNEETGEVKGLSLPAFYFLFSGGALTKVQSVGLDIESAMRWRELVPLVSLFGGAMGNQIMSGKAHIGKAIPICRETAHLIPKRFVQGEPVSIWDLIQEEAFTRRDDAKNHGLRRLLAPNVREALEAGEARAQLIAGTDEDVVEETGRKQQMRYYVETFAAGTRFFWEVALHDVTDVEFDAFAVTLAEFSRWPYIGGKSGVGHGKVRLQFDRWIQIDPRIAPTGKEVDATLGTRYMQHLQQNADAIRSIISSIV